ncbi:putative endopeptidase, NLPC/P60 domain, LRAT-like domain-containing protein [Rosa chinensis]|uniref:Putative endopeptidase, NLPC/P60 domain, LRAT-like domain-containing protein n=1 Tax=Rosa chinensis TaxID=74649 RepID=A0A2P6RFL4_ROSCH|nr:protein LEAD-SENSITIVE 1 [Rosa chinensis]PRQ45207.1 putative endopeptidase, NLPC/P60 domain, LRAT-like domain-containing protein [Rosa chinensis]
MGVLSNKIDRDQLKPGDHIYTWRNAYLYTHHGIYVGEGKVIHFTRAAGREIGTGTVLDRFIFSSSPSHSAENPCTSCDDPSGRDGGVMSSCLDCFLSGGDLYRFEYGVNPAFFLAKARGGTCTLASSDPSEDVLHRAFYLLKKKNGFGSYSLFKNNCEDFAIYCKTGLLVNSSTSLGRSGQASSGFSFAGVASGIGVAAGSSARYLPIMGFGAFSGLGAAFGVGIYSFQRLACDIGFRSDVSKVPVEELWDYMYKNKKK